MHALLFFVLLAQVTASPLPAASPVSPLAGWTPVASTAAPAAGEYAHYEKREGDGSVSSIIASRRVCDCQPAPIVNGLASAVAVISRGTAIEAQSTPTICSREAQRILITNLAKPDNEFRNSETFAFRDRDALVVLNYVFRSEKPVPEEESALVALCPPIAV